jgi:hypothetical protein
MDVPHGFFHCNKERYCSTFFVLLVDPIWRAATEVSCVRNLCNSVHRMREAEMCATSSNVFIALLLAKKQRTVGRYFLDNLSTYIKMLLLFPWIEKHRWNTHKQQVT